ncbi:glutamyl-tRNA(Gln) amidotransferase subunit A, mitochondrial-like [Oppia nitens]|uniref:glutamyl-tRNA(Gln) amidotransferase subunit A, mitochondrial-like n=1 Tax=Oppia nitens TaxID=1686743 RepID=UPI0023DBC92B|nr:glutamyl-tRNA(Gln) amidotransferase subunit A, mitochondrial-like [Oppia nitens]
MMQRYGQLKELANCRLLSASISTVHQLMASGQLSPSDVWSKCMLRAVQTKPLNAFVTLTTDNDIGRQSAYSADARYTSGQPLGRLDGIPIAVKDNICTKNMLTTCAAKMLANYRPPFDATVVRRLVDTSGALMLGKTNMDEFAMGSGCVDGVFGPTVNPWKSRLPFKVCDKLTNEWSEFNGLPPPTDDWFISGGSSGGSAVAVATGSVFAALSSDTGGSTRNPAARVGIVGYKPTYGLVSRFGLIPLTHSLDVIGIMARYVDDVAIILAAIAGHDSLDSTTVDKKIDNTVVNDLDLSTLTIGIPDEYQCTGMSDEVVDTWRSVADRLANMGARVKSVSLPHTKYSISCYSVLNCCEVASNFACYDGIEFGYRSVAAADDNNSSGGHQTVEEQYSKTRHEAFSDTVKGRIFAGNYFLLRENYENYFNRALKVRRLIAEDFDRVFSKQNVDLLLTPVTLTDAPLYSQWIQKDNRQQVSIEDYCTQPVNMVGLPAISIPCRLSSKSGLPLSLQLIGRRFDDYFLLSVAKQLEQLFNFPLLVYDDDDDNDNNHQTKDVIS